MGEDEDDPWLRQFLAGYEARQARKRALVWSVGVPLLLIPIMILLAAITASRAEPALPADYSCADVRAAVEKYGRAKAIRFARRKGATPEQIAAAEKCL